jgi:hypothetical protein
MRMPIVRWWALMTVVAVLLAGGLAPARGFDPSREASFPLLNCLVLASHASEGIVGGFWAGPWRDGAGPFSIGMGGLRR